MGFVLLDLYFSVYCFVDRCLSFFVWSLCYLSFDLRVLVSLNSSMYTGEEFAKLVLVTLSDMFIFH